MNFAITFTRSVLLLASLALIIPAATGAVFTEATPGAIREPVPEGSTLAYPVDPEAIREEFRQSGTVELTLASGETVTVAGRETNIFAEKLYFLAGRDRDDILEARPILSIPIEGRVQGEPDSAARLLLGDWGVYGRVYVGGTAFDFDPQLVAGVYLQHVTDRQVAMAEGERFLSNAMDEGGVTALATPVDSYVIYDVEKSYQDLHPDWYDRVASAFNNLPPLWADADITLLLSGPWGWSEDMISVDECKDAHAQYKTWLGSHLSSIANAYQLWTKRDLELDGWGSLAYGCAPADTTSYGYHGASASSVVEGTNYLGDLYDANSAYERGIISGHELTHIYGQENHRSHCKSSSECNMMKTGVDNSYRHFYWSPDWPSTECEVEMRFHNNAECGGSSDGEE